MRKNISKIIQQIQKICIEKEQIGLLEITEKFDKVKLKTFIYKIPKKIEIANDLKNAIETAKNNIYKFHKNEHDNILAWCHDKIETSKGIECWKNFTPIETVGIYVPNKLFSSVLMNIIPAQIAGCKNIVVCTPPNPSNEILWTLQLLGIEKIYTIGGAQAIFAISYGIGEIPKVDKIFGPGNEFVDAAKRMVSNEVAIDMPAGPSEVLVISDGINYQSIINDLLAQLEHGRKSKAWLYCTNKEVIDFIKEDIRGIAASSFRWDILQHSINNLTCYHVATITQAIEKSNKIAPEHLILNVLNAEKYLNKITNAGSVFIGRNTPESLGDYLSGTNHVLPTSGFARAFSGLSVLSFGKFITFQKATEKGLKFVANKVKVMAESEGLEFHAKSVKRNNKN